METTAVFKSNLFKPFLPEDSQVNPQVYGAELAYWLSQNLAKKGIFTSYPEYEDWGWFIELIVDDNEYWVCCGNIEGESDQWTCFLKRLSKGFFNKNNAPIEPAIPLLQALRSLLQETEAISNIEWSFDNDS
ncbi:hypothetical protein [Pseudoalteromonas sp. H71]|uniref:hypothetical protein n=1 Tax=Pseudoalteromonas sp. H71 TaxID=1348395 RepID=UPI000730DD2D|nr:hypothetical protein [Pseudoalteromonas sp. H71]KTD90355.1 hypothetical protein ATS71_07570 [Pseudoalteromonas sp. H71]